MTNPITTRRSVEVIDGFKYLPIRERDINIIMPATKYLEDSFNIDEIDIFVLTIYS